jgi:hypothetical protein
MQRAATATPLPTLSLSASGSQTPSLPPAKRQRLSDGSASAVALSAEAQAVNAALADEEAKRQEALRKQFREGGETKWAFRVEKRKVNTAGGSVETIGYAGLESACKYEGDEPWRTTDTGRRSFGKFNRALEVGQCEPQDDCWA